MKFVVTGTPGESSCSTSRSATKFVEQLVGGEPPEVQLLGRVGGRSGPTRGGQHLVEVVVALGPERGAPGVVERVDVVAVAAAQPGAEGRGAHVAVAARVVAAELVADVPQRQRGVVAVALGQRACTGRRACSR